MTPAHLQVAEAGKRRQLEGDAAGALERYRTALRMAVGGGASPVFLRHYSDCVLDCLEEAGDAEQALALTETALENTAPGDGPLARMTRAALIQRRALLLFRLGRTVEGDAALRDAPRGGPILEALRDARRRHLTVGAEWIDALRRRHGDRVVTRTALRAQDARRGEDVFMKEASHA